MIGVQAGELHAGEELFLEELQFPFESVEGFVAESAKIVAVELREEGFAAAEFTRSSE